MPQPAPAMPQPAPALPPPSLTRPAPTTPARQMPPVATTAPTTPARQMPHVANTHAVIPFAHYPPAPSTTAAIIRVNDSAANNLPTVSPLTVAAPHFIQVAPRSDMPAMNTRSRHPLLVAPLGTASTTSAPPDTHHRDTTDMPDVDMSGPPAPATTLVVRRDSRPAPLVAGATARLALNNQRQVARQDALEQFRSQLIHALETHTPRAARPADIYAYLPVARPRRCTRRVHPSAGQNHAHNNGRARYDDRTRT